MNFLTNLYGMAKTASGEEINLHEVSAAEFLAANKQGLIEEVGPSFDDFSDEELEYALSQIQEEEELQQKVASGNVDWNTAGRLFARGYFQEQEKLASQFGAEEDPIDLNELSVEEFYQLAAYLEEQGA